MTHRTQAATILAGGLHYRRPCCSQAAHDELKAGPSWQFLEYLGIQATEDGPDLELRNCECGATLAKPVAK